MGNMGGNKNEIHIREESFLLFPLGGHHGLAYYERRSGNRQTPDARARFTYCIGR